MKLFSLNTRGVVLFALPGTFFRDEDPEQFVCLESQRVLDVEMSVYSGASRTELDRNSSNVESGSARGA